MGAGQGGELSPAADDNCVDPIAADTARESREPEEKNGDDLGDHEEGANPRVAKLPILPTREEVDSQMITRVPY